ncbi:MAG: hypothetical protein Q3971_07085 [Moraxella sp.]|nr:hypothetical protein [Moraxella sp.]
MSSLRWCAVVVALSSMLLAGCMSTIGQGRRDARQLKNVHIDRVIAVNGNPMDVKKRMTTTSYIWYSHTDRYYTNNYCGTSRSSTGTTDYYCRTLNERDMCTAYNVDKEGYIKGVEHGSCELTSEGIRSRTAWGLLYIGAMAALGLSK